MNSLLGNREGDLTIDSGDDLGKSCRKFVEVIGSVKKLQSMKLKMENIRPLNFCLEILTRLQI